MYITLHLCTIADYDRPTVNECLSGNGGCEQRCVDTTFSHLCSCYSGYELNLTNRRDCSGEGCWNGHMTCSQYITLSKWAPLWVCPLPFNFYADLNECDVAGTCSQFCKNSHGSYSCACAEGYTLQSGSFCKANGGPAYLLLADQHSIQKIPISNYGTLGTPTILVHSLPQTLAIDVDIRYVLYIQCAHISYSTEIRGQLYLYIYHQWSLQYTPLLLRYRLIPSLPLPSFPLPSSTSPPLPSPPLSSLPHCMQQ